MFILHNLCYDDALTGLEHAFQLVNMGLTALRACPTQIGKMDGDAFMLLADADQKYHTLGLSCAYLCFVDT